MTIPNFTPVSTGERIFVSILVGSTTLITAVFSLATILERFFNIPALTGLLSLF